MQARETVIVLRGNYSGIHMVLVGPCNGDSFQASRLANEFSKRDPDLKRYPPYRYDWNNEFATWLEEHKGFRRIPYAEI
jgi:hypothetical protein